MTSPAYCDADGARHEVAVRETAGGDWQVLDTSAAETRVIETLDGQIDGHQQAEAVACDYLSTVERWAAGREIAEPIPEQGGPDADSDHRPRPGAPQPHARRTALPDAAG